MMVEYILDWMEQRGIFAASEQEQQRMEAGIRQCIRENGVPEDTCRDYFRCYMKRVLGRIDKKDLKEYLMLYPAVSEVQQIAIEYQAKGAVPEKEKKALYQRMYELYQSGLEDRYIPEDVVARMLGA